MIMPNEFDWHQKPFIEIRSFIYYRYRYAQDAAEKLMEIYFEILNHIDTHKHEVNDIRLRQWNTLLQQVGQLRHLYEQRAIHGNNELEPIEVHPRWTEEGARPRRITQAEADKLKREEKEKAIQATPLTNIENTVVVDGVRYHYQDIVPIDIAAKIVGRARSTLYDMNKKSYRGRKPSTMPRKGTRKLWYRVSDLLAFRDGRDDDTAIDAEKERAAVNLEAIERVRALKLKSRK